MGAGFNVGFAISGIVLAVVVVVLALTGHLNAGFGFNFGIH